MMVVSTLATEILTINILWEMCTITQTSTNVLIRKVFDPCSAPPLGEGRLVREPADYTTFAKGDAIVRQTWQAMFPNQIQVFVNH